MAPSQKIAIIGVGLLGGSAALALRNKKKVRLVGWNHRASSRKKAAKLLRVAGRLEEAVEGADLVLLCSHSNSIASFLQRTAPLLSPSALVMDVSSVKGEVVREAAEVPGANRFFVPCHPMAGKEKSGPAHADAGLYRGRVVFITPLPQTPKALVQRAFRFWRSLGAVPLVVDAKVHDRQVALTSHLPHLLACALVDLYGAREKETPKLRRSVGSGFRDFTRIAGGNPDMWGDIVELNRNEIRLVLSRYRRILRILEKNLREGRGAFWKGFFQRARNVREKLG
jgi:prephenate dehydrogenase